MNMSSSYSVRELGEMIYVYGECHGNASQARRQYMERFPRRRHPSSRFFQDLYRRLITTGYLLPRRDLPGTGGHDEFAVNERIIELVEQNPTLSVRRIALQLGISSTKVWRVLSGEGYHPYHYKPVQELRAGDNADRVRFCRKIIERSESDSLFLHRILWTDEAQFDKTGVNNMHNLHRWSHSNPRAVRQIRSQHRFKVNVWAAAIDTYFIGPYIFEGNLSSQSYLCFLRNTLPELLEDVPLNLRRNMVYQHDGAPPHSSREVQSWLNNNFVGHWIGRGGPIEWPPRSPDLTPMDYFIWGYLKEMVYAEEVSSEDQLRARLEEACHKLRERLQTTDLALSVKRRALLCVAENGQHIEQLL